MRSWTSRSGWISGDFHLHSAPSGDSPVPVPGRIRTLAGEGVEKAILGIHAHDLDAEVFGKVLPFTSCGQLPFRSQPGVEPLGHLAEHLYDGETERDSNVLEVHVNHLRRKLGRSVIETRRGQGYLFPERPS